MGSLSEGLIKKIFYLMLKSRILEERLIKIYKKGEAFFWIGGPGEEAFGVPLGLLVHKGKGLFHDWLHLHYRATSTLVAMGLSMVDAVRLIMNRKTDPSTGGRNFSSHYSFPQWNVVPVSSPIEVQYATAIGTAWAQKRFRDEFFVEKARKQTRKNKDLGKTEVKSGVAEKSKTKEKNEGNKDKLREIQNARQTATPDGITIVTGGDAGTHEGDFASSLIWASRKGQNLPLLITVQNNSWGISTPYEEQHGEESIGDRAKAFNIRSSVISGYDPIEAYVRIQEEMNYVRKQRKPAFLEVKVSRLYGHSSSSGAQFVRDEKDPLRIFEKFLLKKNVLKGSDIKKMKENFEAESIRAEKKVEKEEFPKAESIWDHCYVKDENANWRNF